MGRETGLNGWIRESGKRKRRSGLRLLGLCLAFFAGPAAARDLSFDHFIHTKLEAKDGLSVQVNSIVQTPDGHMWFATPDGLYRYNGQGFERMPIAKSKGFVDTAIIEAIVTRRGEIWMGLGQNSGVATLRGDLVVQTDMPSPPPQVTHLVETANGTLWAASSGRSKRLFRFDGKRWHQMDVALAMPVGNVADLEADRQGTLWVSLADPAGGNRLAFLRPGATRFETAPDKIGLGRLTVDRKGGLWISDNFGSRMLRDASGRVPARPIAYPAMPNIGFPRIRFDRNGNLWGSSLSGGMFMIPDAANPARSGTPPQVFGDNDRLGTVATLDVFPDREGNVWISSSESVHRFHPANAVPVPAIASLPGSPQRLALATDGSVYLFSLGNLYRIRPNEEPQLVTSGLPLRGTLCPARLGGVWLLQGAQTLLFDNNGRRSLPARSTAEEPILCEEDGFGRLWAMYRDKVAWLRDGRWTAGFPGLGRVDIWDAATDSSGALVLSVDANRLLRIDANKATALETGWTGSISSLRNTRMGLLASHVGGIWRAAANGQPAANIAARSLARRRDFDVDGDYVWAFGMAGVERIAVAEVEKSWGSDRAPPVGMVIDWREGLPMGKQDVGFRGRQIVAAGDGRIWLLTRAGPYVIDSRHIIRNTIPPPLTVRALFANERGVAMKDGQIDLPAGTRSVRIGYDALSYSMPDRVHFKYRLVGTDDAWTDAGNRRGVTFSNLGPGDYRFEVIGANEDGVWNMKPASVAFTIAPTFVQSVWFKLGVALLLLVAAVMAYRWRMHTLTTRVRNAMAERSAERERIARELHDTLLQSVQALILRFQLLVDRLPDQHRSRNDLLTTLDQADEVLAESRKRVLDLRERHPRSDLRSVIAALVKRQLPSARFKTEIRTSGKIVPIEPTVFNGLVDVANESLFNILRHAEASEVSVEIRYNPSHLELEVRDNGKGLDTESISQALTTGHFGLVGMKERVANLGGRFTIDSEPGRGVTITARIPSIIAYRTKNPQTPQKGRGWLWFARQAQETVSP